MPEEDMIFEEQIEQEIAPEEVENYEEQTEQGATDSLDDILSGVNELLEQSSSYSAYLEEGEPEPENPIIAYDNGNAVAVSDLDAIAVQAANSSVYPGTWSGSILDYFSGVMRQNPGKTHRQKRMHQLSPKAENESNRKRRACELRKQCNNFCNVNIRSGYFLQYC